MDVAHLCQGAAVAVLLVAGCGERVASPEPAAAKTSFVWPETYGIELTGSNHRWVAQYPETNGVASAPRELRPGDELPVPAGVNVALILKSSDYVYTLAVPACGLKEIAVPGLEFRLTYRWDAAGAYELEGEELCGLPGRGRAATLVVEDQQQFLAWLERTTETK